MGPVRHDSGVDAAAEALFAGPGETRALGRAFDWAATPLGPVAGWPADLVAAVRLALAQPLPAAVIARRGWTVCFNDAFVRPMGAGYLDAFGRDARRTFAHLASRFAPLIERAFAGESVSLEATYIPSRRAGPEAPATDTWRDLHYSPVRDAAGAVVAAFCLIPDVTARVLAERRRDEVEAGLRASEARFRALTELAPALLWETDAGGAAVAFNRRWSEYTGQTQADTQAGGWLAAVHPDDRPRTERAFAAAFATGQPLAVEHRLRRHDGAYRWFAVRQFPVRDGGGAPARLRRWFGAALDIDDRKRAEDALRAGEERYRTLVATLPGAAAFVFDRELRYRLAGGEAFRAAGFTPEQFVGRPVAEVLDPALAAEYVPLIRRALHGEPFEVEHAAHGRVFLSRGVPLREGAPPTDARATDARATDAPAGGTPAEVAPAGGGGDAGGRVVAALAVSVDVTARRRTEEALRASEARYRTLVEHVRDYAIMLLDPEGVVTEWTAGAAQVTGYAAAEAVGRHVSLLYTPEDVAAGVPAAHLAQAAAEGRGEWEGWRVRRDGTRFWATEIATAVRESGAIGGAIGGTTGGANGAPGRLLGFTRISRDLTDRRLAEAAAERAQLSAARDDLRRRLAAAEEAERQRLARELHDQLGQELTALRLGLDDAARLAAGHVPPDAPLLGSLARLGAVTQRMTADVRALALELRPPELDDVGLESALETYVGEWGARAGVAAEVAVTGLRGRPLPPDVASALYRIAQEALTNVAKHARATQVNVVVEQPDGEVRLIVEDDGRGFDPEATDARVRRERRLGLAGMRERAALFGGTVAVESSPGGGTTVYARLPLGPAPEGPGAAAGRPEA